MILQTSGGLFYICKKQMYPQPAPQHLEPADDQFKFKFEGVMKND